MGNCIWKKGDLTAAKNSVGLALDKVSIKVSPFRILHVVFDFFLFCFCVVDSIKVIPFTIIEVSYVRFQTIQTTTLRLRNGGSLNAVKVIPFRILQVRYMRFRTLQATTLRCVCLEEMLMGTSQVTL